MDNIGYIQCKVLLTRNILILHQGHYLIQKLLATVREKHLYGILLIRRKRGFARYALNKIPVDFILCASRNLLGCGKVVSIKTLAESGRVRVGGPCPTTQIVEVVDDIQLLFVWPVNPSVGLPPVFHILFSCSFIMTARNRKIKGVVTIRR